MIAKKYILAALLACAPLATQAAETIYTFDNVTGVRHARTQVLITGILVDTTATTVTLPWNTGYEYDRCAQLFNVVLSQPSAFTLTVVTELVIEPSPLPGGNPIQTLYFRRCEADRKP